MNTQRQAIILEILSFFLVTFDLYGKNRLKLANEYIKLKLENGIHNKIKIPLAVLLSIIFIYNTLLPLLIILEGKRLIESENPSQLYYPSVFIHIVVFISVFIIFFQLIRHFYNIINHILNQSIKLFEKYQLSGWMLFFGVALFLYSKWLSWNFS